MNRFEIARAHARATARVAIAAAVLVGCILADCAVLAYELGRQTGAAVHARNDQLATFARRLATGERSPAPAPVVPVAPAPVVTVAAEPAPAPAEPSLADLFAAAAAELAASDARIYRAVGRHTAAVRDLLADVADETPCAAVDPATLTVRELRALTGAKAKRLRKADLVAIAREMAAAA